MMDNSIKSKFNAKKRYKKSILQNDKDKNIPYSLIMSSEHICPPNTYMNY